jgi:hypothetical protein
MPKLIPKPDSMGAENKIINWNFFIKLCKVNVLEI